MKKIDRDAFQRAIEWMCNSSPNDRRRIEDELARKGFEAAGETAAYAAQCETLRLKPWEAPPCHTRGLTPDSTLYGSRPGEIALRDRLLQLGLSIFEPDPAAAILRAEAEQAA